jgi:heat shock protein HslJ
MPVIQVTDPQNYTLFLDADGTFDAKMDCNSANGNYATTGIENPQGSIFMELGLAQMAACGEGSLDTQMMQMFGPAQSYSFEDNDQVLKFIWVAGGPIDYFQRVNEVEFQEPTAESATGTVTAPDGVYLRSGPGTHYPFVGAAPLGATGEIIGVSQDAGWWLADAPQQPGGQVWVTADWVEVTGAENVPVVVAPPVELTLSSVPWQWVSTTDPAQGTVNVNDPSRYVILFNDDGTALIQADCNDVQASYTTDGSNISILPGISTMAACPPDSLDSQFMAQLSSAVIYFIEGGNLYLDLPADGGTMRFISEGSPPPSEDAPAGAGDGLTFFLVSMGPEGDEQELIPGTQITASFANDQVTGNAGCNNYSGTLTPVKDYFTVGPIIVTNQYCAEPAGVMEQEQAYLAALQATGGYEWEEKLVNGTKLVTEGILYYSLTDGTIGTLNFVSSP